MNPGNPSQDQDPFADTAFPAAPAPAAAAYPQGYPLPQSYPQPSSYAAMSSSWYNNNNYNSYYPPFANQNYYYPSTLGATAANNANALSAYQNLSTTGRYGAMLAGGAQSMHQGSTAVLTGIHEAMHRFARVSALLEEVLRNIHMLFDAVFGLGYSITTFYDEATKWVAVKSGPLAFVLRLAKRLRRVWRLLLLFLCSPMAGRFSPVALVLRILGVVPDIPWPDSSYPRPEDDYLNREHQHQHQHQHQQEMRMNDENHYRQESYGPSRDTSNL